MCTLAPILRNEEMCTVLDTAMLATTHTAKNLPGSCEVETSPWASQGWKEFSQKTCAAYPSPSIED